MKSFISTFISHLGETECPPEYLEWGAISAIAAAMGNRTWFEKFKGSKLSPNLYVMLVGESGSGKGITIDAVQRIMQDVPSVGWYRGQITAPAIVDHLSQKATAAKAGAPADSMYLVTPELSMAVGSGDQADRFVKLMTELYTGGDYEFHEATRMNKTHKFKVPTMNWIAGSTEQWMVNSITPDAISGGFFARCVAVSATVDYTHRVADPKGHPRYEELLLELRKWIHRIATQIHGQMYLTKQAKDLNEFWYMNREIPHDEAMLPTWKRAHDLSLKLGMVFAKNDDLETKYIKREHLARGQQLASQMQEFIPHLITLASMTPESDAMRFVTRIIQAAENGIDEPDLLWKASQRGLSKMRTDQVVETLLAARKIESNEVRGRPHYTWKIRRLRHKATD